MEPQIIEGETLTPAPRIESKAQTMDFPDAIKEVIKGKKVTRVSWGNTDYGFLKDEWLTIYTKGKFHTWLISQGDLEGNDWIIVQGVN